MPLAVLAPRAQPPQCPACHRLLAAGPLRLLPGTAGGVVLPIRCSRRRCGALVEVICYAADRHWATLAGAR